MVVALICAVILMALKTLTSTSSDPADERQRILLAPQSNQSSHGTFSSLHVLQSTNGVNEKVPSVASHSSPTTSNPRLSTIVNSQTPHNNNNHHHHEHVVSFAPLSSFGAIGRRMMQHIDPESSPTPPPLQHTDPPSKSSMQHQSDDPPPSPVKKDSISNPKSSQNRKKKNRKHANAPSVHHPQNSHSSDCNSNSNSSPSQNCSSVNISAPMTKRLRNSPSPFAAQSTTPSPPLSPSDSGALNDFLSQDESDEIPDQLHLLSQSSTPAMEMEEESDTSRQESSSPSANDQDSIAQLPVPSVQPLRLEFHHTHASLRKENKRFKTIISTLRPSKYTAYTHCKFCYREQHQYGDDTLCIRCGLPLSMYAQFKPEDRFCMMCAVMNKTETERKGRCSIHPVSAKNQDKGSIFVLFKTQFSIGSATKTKKPTAASEALDNVLQENIWKLNQIIRYEFFSLMVDIMDAPYDKNTIESTIRAVRQRQQEISPKMIINLSAYRIEQSDLSEFTDDEKKEFVLRLSELLFLLDRVLTNHLQALMELGGQTLKRVCLRAEAEAPSKQSTVPRVISKAAMDEAHKKRKRTETDVGGETRYGGASGEEGSHSMSTEEFGDLETPPTTEPGANNNENLEEIFPSEGLFSDLNNSESLQTTDFSHPFTFEQLQDLSLLHRDGDTQVEDGGTKQPEESEQQRDSA